MNFKEHTRHIGCGVFCLTDSFDKMGEGYYRGYVTFTKLTNWVSVYNNPECVKSILNKRYWDAEAKLVKNNDDDDKTTLYWFVVASLIAIALILILLGVIVIRKCVKSKDNNETDTLVTKETEF